MHNGKTVMDMWPSFSFVQYISGNGIVENHLAVFLLNGKNLLALRNILIMAKLDTAIFAGGCFWGVEHLMKNTDGVVSVECGFTGGHKPDPTYREVCSGTTGHAEAVRIVFDAEKVSYETLAKRFFEIHDPEQRGGQGPDLGEQYRSEIFYLSGEQKETAEKLVRILVSKGYDVATGITPASEFWPAEDYHQHYYETAGKEPYCHMYVKRF